eukprot:6192010-Pleurochrysis_carterae.AAC.7
MALAANENVSESLSITLHTYKPELRTNGSDRRPPEAQGGDNMVSELPNRHSVHVASQSWLPTAVSCGKIERNERCGA